MSEIPSATLYLCGSVPKARCILTSAWGRLCLSLHPSLLPLPLALGKVGCGVWCSCPQRSSSGPNLAAGQPLGLAQPASLVLLLFSWLSRSKAFLHFAKFSWPVGTLSRWQDWPVSLIALFRPSSLRTSAAPAALLVKEQLLLDRLSLTKNLPNYSYLNNNSPLPSLQANNNNNEIIFIYFDFIIMK